MSGTAAELTAKSNHASSPHPPGDSLNLMGTSIPTILRRLTATAVLAAAYASAQAPAPAAPPSTTLVEPPTPLLPSDATLVSPTVDLPVPDDNSETQAILKEDGLVRMESRVKLVPTASKAVSNGRVKG